MESCSPAKDYGGWASLVEASVDPSLEALVLALRTKAARAKVTASHMRLWESYLLLRRTARADPFVFRIVMGSTTPDSDSPRNALRKYRTGVRHALSELISTGLAKAELLSGLDPDRVVDRFLRLCIADGTVLSLRPVAAPVNRFEQFWNSIAAPGNCRCRSTPRPL